MMKIVEKKTSSFDGFFSSVVTFFERLFTWKGELNKFIEWTNQRDLKIVKIEGCSYTEAGFSFSQISRGHSCAKLEIVNSRGETGGLYLMVFNWADAGLSKSRFVPASEIKFFQPYKIVNNRLVPFSSPVEIKR